MAKQMTGIDEAQLAGLIEQHKDKKSVEGLAQILLEMGYDPSMLKGAKLKDVIAFQKHLLDKSKLDLEQKKFEVALSKLMSGEVVFMDGIEEEAELIDRGGQVPDDPPAVPESPETTEEPLTQKDGE